MLPFMMQRVRSGPSVVRIAHTRLPETQQYPPGYRGTAL